MDKQLFVGVADMPAAVRIEVRNTVVSALYNIIHFLRNHARLRAYIARPLNGIAVRSAVFNPQKTARRNVYGIAHYYGTAVNVFAARLLLPMVPRYILKQI